jgi:acyl-coenzyme A thioesterase PaaI-like protein
VSTTRPFPEHDRCFVCGSANAVGLHLTFERSADRVRCRARIDERFQSYEGMVHGGILAAITDAAMVHLVRGGDDVRPLTCRLEIRYRGPVFVGEDVEAEARFSQTRLGIARAACTLTVGDRLCVEATASFRLAGIASPRRAVPPRSVPRKSANASLD